MARSCKVCQHKDRKAIETKIIRGVSHTVIGREYGISNMSVRYHTSRHLPKKLIATEEAKEIMHSTTMFDSIMELVDKTKGILKDMETKDRPLVSLACVRELRETYSFMCKISAYLSEQQQKDEEENKQKQIDDLGNLSDKELTLLEELLRKTENGGGGPEILGIPWKIALKEDDIYLYQRVMETIKDDKEARERVARGEVLYYEEEERKRKLKIRKRVQKDFEDEKKRNG